MGDAFEEKRKDRRLDLALPVEYSVAGAVLSAVPRTGHTRNVCSGGVYFETDIAAMLTPQTDITLRIAIPRRQDTGGPPLTLVGEGKVLRVERVVPAETPQLADIPRWGIAVEFYRKPTVRLFSLADYLTDDSR